MFLLAACQSPKEPEKPAAQRKNILLITMDALRQDHLSTFGYERPTAPNLNWLSVNGLAVRNLIPTGCTAPISLTSLLTGRPFSYDQMAGDDTLADANLTLAEILETAGYHTAAFVASADLARARNFDQGFAVYEDFGTSAERFVTADVPVKAAIAYLRSQRDGAKPFFIYLHLREPHPPWRHPSPWLSGEEKSESFFDNDCNYLPSGDELVFVEDHQKNDLIAKYDAALRFADAQIGELFGELRSGGEIDRTVIAVTAPHGIELLDRYSATHAYNPFDEVLRGALLLLDQSASFKETIAPSLQARIFDVAPTLLGRAGVEIPASVEGVDLLTASTAMPELAFSHCANADVVRTLDYKLVDFDFSEARRQKRNPPSGMQEGLHLFALRADPGEKVDVKESHPEELERLKAALEDYRKRLGKPPGGGPS
jgi:arylsulfatase A-like enzyme